MFGVHWFCSQASTAPGQRRAGTDLSGEGSVLCLSVLIFSIGQKQISSLVSQHSSPAPPPRPSYLFTQPRPTKIFLGARCYTRH